MLRIKKHWMKEAPEFKSFYKPFCSSLPLVSDVHIISHMILLSLLVSRSLRMEWQRQKATRDEGGRENILIKNE